MRDMQPSFFEVGQVSVGSGLDARRAGVALLFLAGSAREARADEKPAFTIGAKPAWYVLGGATGGGTVVAHGGGFIGGELSVVRLREGRFIGLYGDTYYDLGIHRTYATSGVELGYKFFGFDAGGASRFGGDRAEWGATGRVFLTVGVISLYARYAYFPEPIDARNNHVVQFGGLFKLPFAAWGSK